MTHAVIMWLTNAAMAMMLITVALDHTIKIANVTWWCLEEATLWEEWSTAKCERLGNKMHTEKFQDLEIQRYSEDLFI